MAAAVYTVKTTFNPGVQYQVSAAEYERLQDLGAVTSLDAVTTPPDPVVISPTAPSSPAVGQVWFNPSVP